VILADSSVWIDHLRSGNAELSAFLQDDRILVHPFVIGELACGNVPNREAVRRDLELLPGALVAHHAEVMHFVNEGKLWGIGIGWIDAHLLASARLSNCSLWTFERALERAAARLGAGHTSP